jgi:hypothetical protein
MFLSFMFPYPYLCPHGKVVGVSENFIAYGLRSIFVYVIVY